MSDINPYDPELTSTPETKPETEIAEVLPPLYQSSVEHTLGHFVMHYKRALRELMDSRVAVNLEGLSRFALAMILADASRRAGQAQLPLDTVIHHIFHQAYEMAQGAEEKGNSGDAKPEPDDDL